MWLAAASPPAPGMFCTMTRRVARDVLAEMAREIAGIEIEAAAGGGGDDDPDLLALVEVGDRFLAPAPMRRARTSPAAQPPSRGSSCALSLSCLVLRYYPDSARPAQVSMSRRWIVLDDTRSPKVRELDLADTGDARLPRHLSAASGLACAGSLHLRRGRRRAASRRVRRDRQRARPPAPPVRRRTAGGEGGAQEAEARPRSDHAASRRSATTRTARCWRSARARSATAAAARCCGWTNAARSTGAPRVVDVSPLFEELDRHCPALNIEGAVAIGDELRLLQRANKKHPQNAIVRYPLAADSRRARDRRRHRSDRAVRPSTRSTSARSTASP